MSEANDYKGATSNILNGIMVGTAENPVSPYEKFPGIYVTGLLEFVGLHGEVRNLQDNGLNVYFYENEDLEFDFEFHDDLFTGINLENKTKLLSKADPKTLDMVCSTLKYYHKDRMVLDGAQALWEINPVLNAFYWTESGDCPLSDELKSDLAKFGDSNSQFYQDIRSQDQEKVLGAKELQHEYEKRIIREIANTVKHG